MYFTATQSEAVERIVREHDALREKVRRIHSVLAQPQPAQDEIDVLLHEFLNALMLHFSNEEEHEGFFAEVTTRAPRLAGHAGKLCVEHEEILRAADMLCRFAAAGSPSMPWWRELRTRCHEFTKQLMHHESEENKLLQKAHQMDVGVYD